MSTKDKKIFIKQYLLSGIVLWLMLLVNYFTESNYVFAIPIAIPIIAAGLAAAGGAASASGGSGGYKPYSQRWTSERLNQLLTEDPIYGKDTLGLAKTLLNSRMTGAAAMERNIYGTQANTIANINHNATDSSQAIAAAAGVQGQTNENFGQMQLLEGQDYNNKLSYLTDEEGKVHDDNVRRWQDQVNTVMTQYKMRTKRRADAGKVIGGIFTGAASMLGGIGGGK